MAYAAGGSIWENDDSYIYKSEPTQVNEMYYLYHVDFENTAPNNNDITKIIHDAGTNFAWTGTYWDALGGTVDFSDYYNREQVDGKLQEQYSALENYYSKTSVDSMLSSKSDKTAIVFTQNASSISVELGSNSDNKEFRIVDNASSPTSLSEIGTATINVSITNGSFNNDYITGLTFRTAATGTITMSYTGTGILQWVGTDCDVQDGYSVFTPQNSMTYDIVFYFNGARFVGLVNGYEELNVEK